MLCLSIAATFLGISWYREAAFDSREARLSILSGTVLTRGNNLPAWVSASQNMALVEGDIIKTDHTSQALVTLFDHSTVQLFSGSELQIVTLVSSRFGSARQSLALSQLRGKARIGVAPSPNTEKRFVWFTPQGVVLLNEGSFSVNVNEKSSQVRVHERGSAMASSSGGVVGLKANERLEILAGRAPGLSQPAKEELIFNGDFSQGSAGWRIGNELGFPEGQDIEGTATLVLEEGHPAFRFSRRGSKGTHCETYIYQEINRDVSDFSTLMLSLKFKLVHQNLSGGGYMGSEYPLMVRIDYRAVDGGDTFSVYGFYYQNEAKNRTDNGLLAPQDVWLQYTVPENLKTLIPQPRQILGVRVSGSGWDYESLVSNVSLVGE